MSSLYTSIFGKNRQGLFSSIYGRPDVGLFSSLFSKGGSSPAIHSTDIRLGGLSDDATTSGFLSQSVAGIPLWLIAIFILGFVYSRKS